MFGRRGSGKSSLLRKAAADLTVDRRPIAYVDLESFKGHSYPDVLLSVLIKTFSEFAHWLRTAAIYPAHRKSFWKNLFSSTPNRPSFNRREAEKLAITLDEQIKALNILLFSADEKEVQIVRKHDVEASSQKEVEAATPDQIAKLSAKIGGGQKTSTSQEIHESFHTRKTDFLHRHILKYQQIFREIATLSDGDSYLFLDDLYYIRRSDQAKVVDYFHRIAKNNKLWLKIGTIRHRTTWYIHGDPSFGMKLGDDAHDINLDLTLEEYNLTKGFLIKVLDGFLSEVGGLKSSEILVDGVDNRLVLASGGVARDFLGVFRRSIKAAQSRGKTSRGPKIGLEDVNSAAGQYSSTKREEFREDTLDDSEHISLEESFQRIREFCVNQAVANLFLVNPYEDSQGYVVIQELVDLRLIHKVNSRVTVSKRQGKIYEAYMLDVSEYTKDRKKRGFEEIMFWGKDRNEKVRQIKLILHSASIVGKAIASELKRGRSRLSTPKLTKSVSNMKKSNFMQTSLFDDSDE